MSQSRGCMINSCLFLIIIFLPVVGHIIETIMILEDEHSTSGKVLWLAVVWLLPFVGAFLYLIFGQRPPSGHKVIFGQAS